MVKLELIEQIISTVDLAELANIFDIVMLKHDDTPDKVLQVLDIKYVEPYDDETDSHWLNRIKGTEYGIVESFCNSCKAKNTLQTIEIAREKGKLVDLFDCILGETNFKTSYDFREAFKSYDELTEVSFDIVDNVIYALNLDEF